MGRHPPREKVLKGKKSQDDPPYLSRWTGGPGGQGDQGHGVVLHDQGQEHQKLIANLLCTVICTVRLYSTFVLYDCTVRLYSTIVQYDCTVRLYCTFVQNV